MWIVYFEEDSWQCGFQVKSEKEAMRYCQEHKGFTYVYACIQKGE